MNPQAVYVLKNKDGEYLAPTVFTKFNHLTLGDCVPEQQYACRYYERNQVAAVAVRLGKFAGWRIVRLRSTSARKSET